MSDTAILKPPLICLMGPTASGKTELALRLVQELPCEIISVDSAMIYRGMNIGTAKPSPEILKIAPHRLLDQRDPLEIYSAADFCADALREIKDIHAHGKIPLLVGGTMLYFRALQKGLADLPAANSSVRAELLAIGEREGWPFLHERLTKLDPETAGRLHPHDKQRIQRALEVYELTGRKLSELQHEGSEVPLVYTTYNLAIAPHDRAILHERIAIRFRNMLTAGLVDEVRALMMRGDLTRELPAMRAVGYSQVWSYLLGELSYAEMEERGIIATRQLAKRQLTWLRSWSGLVWFDSEAKKLVSEVLHHLREQVFS